MIFKYYLLILVLPLLIFSSSAQNQLSHIKIARALGKTYMAQLMAMITWAKQVQANQPIWGLAKWGTIKKLNFRSYQLACSA